MKQRSGLLSALLLAVSSVVPAQTPAPVQPDRPSGSPREAELAKLITAIEDAYTDRAAVFTRDGRTVIFSSFRDGLPQLYAAPADNPDAPTTRLSRTTERIPGAVVLPDGKTLIYRSDKGADESWSLFRMRSSTATCCSPGTMRNPNTAGPAGACNAGAVCCTWRRRMHERPSGTRIAGTGVHRCGCRAANWPAPAPREHCPWSCCRCAWARA